MFALYHTVLVHTDTNRPPGRRKSDVVNGRDLRARDKLWRSDTQFGETGPRKKRRLA